MGAVEKNQTTSDRGVYNSSGEDFVNGELQPENL
jgi:hypothetical protein